MIKISISNTKFSCWNELDSNGSTYYTTGKRKVLFKVDKYKFSYPVPRSTTLYYYPNFPIIQSLDFTAKTNHDNSKTTTILCNNQQVTLPIEYIYDEVTFRPYVSYSIALYSQKPSCLFDSTKCDFEISNLDIFTLEDDSLFLNPFTMCFPSPSKNFTPSDFLIEVSVTDPLLGTVSPVCEFDTYYLYEVEVIITLTLSPVVNLSTIDLNTLNVLNYTLGKPADNTLFTQCELESVTEIDFSGLYKYSFSIKSIGVDYNIFDYLPNLVSLNLSNTDASTNSSSNFTHLTNLLKLAHLNLSNNNFTSIPIEISYFYSLVELIISDNSISDLTPLSSYDIDIVATNQTIDYGQLQSQSPGVYSLDLSTFLLDKHSNVPCIDFISDNGTCNSIDNCSCEVITWSNAELLTSSFFTFSNSDTTFTGTVTVKFNPILG